MNDGAGIQPKGSLKCIGIDLGTTNSSASVYSEGKSIPFPLSARVANPGGKSLPSVVRFEGGKRDQLSVGREAKAYLLIKPEEVFASVKTVMRKTDWKNDPELVERFNVDGQPIEPEEIAAEVLKQLVEEVNNQEVIDLKGEVRRAVICVPANSTDAYRRGVRKAAALAGLGERDDVGEVILDENGDLQGIYLLEESTAAALEYGQQLGFWDEEKVQTILVYDLGGGTFDVTALSADSSAGYPPKFTVLATKGVARLGGDDFDRALMEICSESFRQEVGIDIFDLGADQGGGVAGKELKTAQQKLWAAAEKAKVAFAGGSSREEIAILGFLKDGNGTPHDLVVEVTKKEFLDRIEPLLKAAQDCVLDALGEANLGLDDLNRIVMVGGSTKADWVNQSIMDLYPSGQARQPFVADDVDLVVSRGAAFWGESKSRPTDEPSVVTVDNIVSHNLGVELEGGVFGLVLPKLLPLTDETPVQTALQTFGNPDQRDYIRITTWKTQENIEAEEIDDAWRAKDRHFVSAVSDLGQNVFEYVGEIILKGIPKAPKGTLPVVVSMQIDRENLLKVSATCSGEEIEVEHSLS